MKLIQTPSPSRHCLCYCGEILEFRLESDTALHGQACLRTNLGNAEIMRREKIEKIEKGISPAAQDWNNYPMKKVDDFTYTIRLFLTDPGHFEAKCFVMQEDSEELLWPKGDNVHINVEPAAYCCANSIYCAFVRQFGRNKTLPKSQYPEGITTDLLKKFDDDAFSLIPPSGTFRDLIRELDHIFSRLHCRILHLLPVNPTPTVYGRMGRYGSPYASLDFTAINPELAEFDRSATPLDQFMELVDAVHGKNGKLFIDIAINHTGWAAKLHETHPEWLVRNEDGSIHSPGAWGVTWGDLTELDHSKKKLWIYLADVFRTWCMRGVDGFRCDAGYMIPQDAWDYIVAKVRSEFPDTIFLLEGLGGPPAVTDALLNQANMNWAYSELFQNYSRQQVEGYLNYAWTRSAGDGIMVHYAETHDNNRLAATSCEYAKLRTALSAFASTSGAFGFTNGVEWFAKEKIDVHESSALNWGAENNQADFIGKINLLLASHPAFRHHALLCFADSGNPDGILICRNSGSGLHPLIIAANLNMEKSIRLEWNSSSVTFDKDVVYDLLTGRKIELIRPSAGKRGLILSGGQILCLSPNGSFCGDPDHTGPAALQSSRAVSMQEASAMAMKVISVLKKDPCAGMEEQEKLAARMLRSPRDFFTGLCGDTPSPMVIWHWPEDLKRHVMIPPGYFLLIEAPYRFRACIRFNGKVFSYVRAIAADDGKTFFAFLTPPQKVDTHSEAKLITGVFCVKRPERKVSPLLLLAPHDETIPVRFNAAAVNAGKSRYLRSNGRGGLVFFPLRPEKLFSRYDSLLLANLHPDYPVDRHVMLRRFRFWAIGQARREEFRQENLCSFHIAKDHSGIWTYEIPVGNGLSVTILVRAAIVPGENACTVTLWRILHGENDRRGGGFKGKDQLRILIRPDMEDRSYHGDTKASCGPEQFWGGKVKASADGFLFEAASDRFLDVRISSGTFQREDEWLYNRQQEDETSRGLSDTTDLYSPGTFFVPLDSNQPVTLLVRETGSKPSAPVFPSYKEENYKEYKGSAEEILEDSLAQFVVKRETHKTVIAGYPWFLDWGRDTLIAARGLLASPRFRQDVKEILLQFASFAENGTIPNMICGGNADNRDTSDAPLWLFTVCSDLCREEGSFDFLDTVLKRTGKTLRQTLCDLAEGILQGTPNGIKADPESMLVFSPAHFTWMDTNYPAGTPREGYPVEIQALWYAALDFLSRITGETQWRSYAQKVRDSILKYYPLSGKYPGKGYLSDCLHCSAGTPASRAVADDHLRPNQLYAVVLGAIPEEEMRLRKGILHSCASLLVPGGMRTLADKAVDYRLPITGGLNDPAHPYWGHYEGDEDTRRKPAYHNGTAWTLPFPLYSEAFYLIYGKAGLPTARSVLSSSVMLFRKGTCAVQLPEIMDGDYPHTPRGCQAQAWGISELFRVWMLLKKAENE